jgi:hypothetical protein
MKPWYKSKTIILNAAVLVASVLTALAGDPAFAAYASQIATALALTNIVLRIVTSQSIGKE